MATTGCHTIRTPFGAYNVAEATPPAESPAPKSDAKAKKPAKKAKTRGDGQPGPTAVVFLGIGAAFMMISMAALTVDEGADHPEFGLITGGTGLILWGAGGIAWAVEDD